MVRKKKPIRKVASARAQRGSSPKSKPDQLDIFIVAAAKALDLPTHEEWLPAIKTNLRVILEHAQSVEEFKLPDGAEPAPVFKA